MSQTIEVGFPAFIKDGGESVGVVRALDRQQVTIYVENAGDFHVPLSAVRDAHSGKVLLDPDKLEPAMQTAIGHIHDAEDPKLVG